MIRSILIAFLVFFCLPVGGLAQDDFGNLPEQQSEEQDGLESATPTDDINEIGNNSSGDLNQTESQQGSNQTQQNTQDAPENGIENSIQDGAGFGSENSLDGSGGNQTSQSTQTFNNANLGNESSSQGFSSANQAVPSEPVTTLNQPNSVSSNRTLQGVESAENPEAPPQALMQEISSQNSAAAPSNSSAITSEMENNQNLSSQSSSNDVIVAPPIPFPNDFAGAPPVPGSLRQVSDGEAPQEYLVQSGDTLFDICDQLLDEPGYWPKLWSLNPDIKNPHFIFPNMRLRFYPGDDDTPPFLQVVAEEEVIPIDKGDLDEAQLVAEKVDFEVETTPLEEIQTEVIGREGIEADSAEILTAGDIYSPGSIQVQVPGFIFKEEREALGFVIGGSGGEISAGPGKKILIEEGEGVQNGSVYTVLRKGERILDVETGDFVGQKYYFVSNARIQRKVDDSVYIAIVENVRLAVMPDDIVVSYISTMRNVPATGSIGSLSSVSATVVGFQYFQQEIGGMGNFAFLDKGNGDGISPGMYLPVFSTPGYLTSSFGDPGLPDDYQMIGVVRIIDTTDVGSVGYIISNNRELRVGDRTGKG